MVVAAAADVAAFVVVAAAASFCYLSGMDKLAKSKDVALNKLIILYMLSRAKRPLSAVKMAEHVERRRVMGYLDFMQGFNELLDAGFIRLVERVAGVGEAGGLGGLAGFGGAGGMVGSPGGAGGTGSEGIGGAGGMVGGLGGAGGAGSVGIDGAGETGGPGRLMASPQAGLSAPGEVEGYGVTQSGLRALADLRGLLAPAWTRRIDRGWGELEAEAKAERSVQAEAGVDACGRGVASLAVFDGEQAILRIELLTGAKADALAVCERWRRDAARIYAKVLDALTGDG